MQKKKKFTFKNFIGHWISPIFMDLIQGSLTLIFKNQVGQVILRVMSFWQPVEPNGQDKMVVAPHATLLWQSIMLQESLEESGLFSEAYQALVSARLSKNPTLINHSWGQISLLNRIDSKDSWDPWGSIFVPTWNPSKNSLYSFYFIIQFLCSFSPPLLWGQHATTQEMPL